MKRKFYRLILALAIFSAFSGNAEAKEYGQSLFKPMVWFFPIRIATLTSHYSTNDQMFRQLYALVRSNQYQGQIESIHIFAAASPIGPRDYNMRLAQARAASMEHFVKRNYPEIEPGIISMKRSGIDWDGFLYLVNKDPDLPFKREILNLLRSHLPEEVLLQKLREVGGQGTQNYLLRNIYPRLQYATVQIRLKDGRMTYVEGRSPLRTPVYYEAVPLVRTVLVEKQPQQQAPADTAGIRLKTNLLYDAFMTPNLEFEWLPSRRFSLQLEGYYAWWSWNTNHYGMQQFWRVQALGAEFRYWLGPEQKWKDQPRRNTGWFAALYGMAGTYDIRLFPKDYKSPGYQSNFAYTLGLAAGYTLPIGRRTYLEFELGLGILGGEYKKYRASYCDGCYPLLEKKRSHYFGPTKAAINLVWNIGKVEDSKREEARPAR